VKLFGDYVSLSIKHILTICTFNQWYQDSTSDCEKLLSFHCQKCFQSDSVSGTKNWRRCLGKRFMW